MSPHIIKYLIAYKDDIAVNRYDAPDCVAEGAESNHGAAVARGDEPDALPCSPETARATRRPGPRSSAMRSPVTSKPSAPVAPRRLTVGGHCSPRFAGAARIAVTREELVDVAGHPTLVGLSVAEVAIRLGAATGKVKSRCLGGRERFGSWRSSRHTSTRPGWPVRRHRRDAAVLPDQLWPPFCPDNVEPERGLTDVLDLADVQAPVHDLVEEGTLSRDGLPGVAVEAALGDVTVDLDLGVGVALAQDAPVTLVL